MRENKIELGISKCYVFYDGFMNAYDGKHPSFEHHLFTKWLKAVIKRYKRVEFSWKNY